MAAPATLPALLDTLTKSLATTLEAAPKLASFSLLEDGISLLDVKNELLLSYLQNLVFLILLKLRQSKNGKPETENDEENLGDLVVSKLVELRLYLEKGTRPLEDKLKYQIDKVLRAADDAGRAEQKAAEAAAAIANGESSDAESDSEAGSEDEEDGVKLDTAVAGIQARANLAAWSRPAAAAASTGKSTDKSGVYRPPKIAPVSMPTTERRERKEKPMKSHTLDEFIADEMSTAPVAQPSIGTTIMQGGRKIKTSSERAKEEERREYEERNFVRLPKESKKDRKKRGLVEGGRMNFGGEEWRGLSEGVDRISKLTKGKSTGGGGGTKALLEKSRKRGLDTTDGPRGSGANMGERYQKRLRTLEGGRGSRGKGR